MNNIKDTKASNNLPKSKNTIAIIGSGTMGSGIAQVAALSDCKVILFDLNQEALEKSKNDINKIVIKLFEKGKLNTEQKSNIESNIFFTNNIQEVAEADVVIEAIVENLAIKQKLFVELEQLVSQNTILATNTSSLSIASIAGACQFPERVIGIHFFNPAPVMPLVEIIPAVQTSDIILQKTIDLLSNWNKTVALAKDTPGFIVNRVARPFYGESLRIFEEGIADFATIDWSLKTIGGFKMGPFELMDFIGNDVNYTVTDTVFTAFYFDPKYKPSLTQKRLVEAGFLGKKSGRGFYNYNQDIPKPTTDRILAQSIFDRVIVMLINEAADAYFLNIASANDINMAMTKGVNYPKGLLDWANELGIPWCVNKLDELYNEYHEDRYRCSPILRKLNRNKLDFDSKP
ncbi:3-hydroxyacyl-CoA dehydrogenase NAD-binding domain-containing protein [Flavobacterium branchiophilum]|uniref:3-hydroxybutyryl-CoA dehydrogenase n=1 Tax=Flavobacterium branchiophilum TaxID=55197 RepID=A0A2H3KQN7_9FLAO|nr:3-hydroxyacyl-CoA dehydrogenase NAD-binding domain-containing protein [Flavobacterium branchiophilum]PDS26818.1 3-hydroxybutyryl-CoA dehydrogenase [Flavobacterium branchiophilum]